MKQKRRRKNRIPGSSRTLSTAVFIELVVAGILVLSFAASWFWIREVFQEQGVQRLLDTTEIRTERIAQNLSFYQMDLSSTDTSISADIDETASFMDGRIMVISEKYHILKDTYVLKQGDYIISRDVSDVIRQKVRRIRRIRGNTAEVILPIPGDGKVLGAVVATASARDIQENTRNVMNACLLIFGVLFAADLLLIGLTVQRSMKGINEVNEQLYHMTQGNLQNKIEGHGFREARYLAENYNRILEKFESVDQTRTEFVSNVSHELKTPITSMKVLAEALTENEASTAEDYREFMTDIVDEIDRETKIINDLLTLVRTDNREYSMNFEKASVNEMLDGVIRTVEPLAKKRNIQLNYETYRDVTAEIDAVKLSLAISNLVENAVKYNIDSGWIRVTLNADHKFFYIKVADSGVGIPEDARDKVFERFYRVDKARSRDTGGTGLGLSITRNIVNAHGGTIRLYSESGKGTTFSVKIPLEQNKKGMEKGTEPHAGKTKKSREKGKNHKESEKSGEKHQNPEKSSGNSLSSPAGRMR